MTDDADDLGTKMAELTERLRAAEEEAQHWLDMYTACVTKGQRTDHFTSARTLVTRESQGRRPYLIMTRNGWASVVRLGLIVDGHMTEGSPGPPRMSR
jgi:hypothetical protein